MNFPSSNATVCELVGDLILPENSEAVGPRKDSSLSNMRKWPAPDPATKIHAGHTHHDRPGCHFWGLLDQMTNHLKPEATTCVTRLLWWYDEQTWRPWSPKPQTSTRASEPEVKTICCSSENAAGKMAVTWTVPVSVCRYVWSTSDASVKMWNCQKAWGVTEFKTCSQNILVLHATGVHLSSHQAGPYPSSKWRWCRWSPWS